MIRLNAAALRRDADAIRRRPAWPPLIAITSKRLSMEAAANMADAAKRWAAEGRPLGLLELPPDATVAAMQDGAWQVIREPLDDAPSQPRRPQTLA